MHWTPLELKPGRSWSGQSTPWAILLYFTPNPAIKMKSKCQKPTVPLLQTMPRVLCAVWEAQGLCQALRAAGDWCGSVIPLPVTGNHYQLSTITLLCFLSHTKLCCRLSGFTANSSRGCCHHPRAAPLSLSGTPQMISCHQALQDFSWDQTLPCYLVQMNYWAPAHSGSKHSRSQPPFPLLKPAHSTCFAFDKTPPPQRKKLQTSFFKELHTRIQH